MDAYIGLAFLAEMSTQKTFLVIGGGIAITGIIFGCMTKILTVRAREQTRREVAAYVAAGSIDPQTGVEMIRAGRTYEEAMGDMYDSRAGAKAAKAEVKAQKKAATVAIESDGRGGSCVRLTE